MWKLELATYNEGKVLVMCKGDRVQFPSFALIASGDEFQVGGKSYRVVETKNVRDENILTTVEEMEDDKPTQGRKRSKSSGAKAKDQVESGLDSTD